MESLPDAAARLLIAQRRGLRPPPWKRSSGQTPGSTTGRAARMGQRALALFVTPRMAGSRASGAKCSQVSRPSSNTCIGATA